MYLTSAELDDSGPCEISSSGSSINQAGLTAVAVMLVMTVELVIQQWVLFVLLTSSPKNKKEELKNQITHWVGRKGRSRVRSKKHLYRMKLKYVLSMVTGALWVIDGYVIHLMTQVAWFLFNTGICQFQWLQFSRSYNKYKQEMVEYILPWELLAFWTTKATLDT